MKKTDAALDVKRLLLETDLPDRAMARGVREALLLHKRLDAPIAVWKDGAVAWIPADEIEVPPADDPVEPSQKLR
jgi:hypothetical protein